jgi:hypothetical protein
VIGAMVAGAVILSSAAVDAAEPQRIGVTSIIVRSVTGDLEEKRRQLVIDDRVHRNELLSTAEASAAEVVFLDGTKVSLGPNVKLTLDEFVYDPDTKDGKFVMTATEGVFRFFSGNLDKSSYVIRTPTATIGIRGTVFTCVTRPDGTTAISLESLTSLVSVQGLTGQVHNLVQGGTTIVAYPNGRVTPPGPPPTWAATAIAILNSLLGQQGNPPPPSDLLRAGIPENPCADNPSPSCG